ncbi:hypothetical protein MWU65_09090 [Cellulophaga sp. F20128]|uniref:hypothetical protein n=1 Tax=Cellulophaga sp. F20128 TaxID=2926413 RepID=UPI001FF23627|nr:hypothetical protein [Cellulophaga sp. F20128]MCK0157330.1 hypothetical protein [Cellulophaga sp. F20128]
MKVTDFTYLLQQPDKVNSPVLINQLEEIITDYPYFQAAHALHLKGLKNLNSFKYNKALKVTAAHTANRDVLFDFITSPEFLNNTLAANAINELAQLKEIKVDAEELTKADIDKSYVVQKSIDDPLPQNEDDADKILDDNLFESKEPITKEETAVTTEKLSLGEPLNFTKKEKFSFTKWLELTTPAIEEDPVQPAPEKVKKPRKNKKFDLIDKFIANNPKIVPTKNIESKIDISSSVKFNKDELMTETLAKVYLEQKKYKKAIQAYKILSLKYPEKSSFFADRIKSVEKIQKENI